MKERPIIFSGPMVRAILDGRKTQTRMVVKPQPVWSEQEQEWQWDHAGAFCAWSGKNCAPTACALIGLRDNCPHGSVGDRLWVRETFQMHATLAGIRVTYREDDSDVWIDPPDEWKEIPDDNHWRPSIHMPRWASRITLEITGVRVERLQEISEEDAKAEGVEPVVDNSPFGNDCGWLDYCNPESLPFDHDKPSASFRSLWNSIHGAGSWETNPWVWVIEFKRNDKLTRDTGTQKL